MHNGVNIRDLNGVEVSTSQFPLVGYTVFWRLAGIGVSHPDLEQALQATGFDKYLPDPPMAAGRSRAVKLEMSKGRMDISSHLRSRMARRRLSLPTGHTIRIAAWRL